MEFLKKGTWAEIERIKSYPKENLRLRTVDFGKFDGYDGEVWFLFDKNGEMLKHSAPRLPKGFVEWTFETERFPQKNCGIKMPNPIFRLKDGARIKGSRCQWMPLNKKAQKKREAAMKRLLKAAKKN